MLWTMSRQGGCAPVGGGGSPRKAQQAGAQRLVLSERSSGTSAGIKFEVFAAMALCGCHGHQFIMEFMRFDGTSFLNTCLFSIVLLQI